MQDLQSARLPCKKSHLHRARRLLTFTGQWRAFNFSQAEINTMRKFTKIFWNTFGVIAIVVIIALIIYNAWAVADTFYNALR